VSVEEEGEEEDMAEEERGTVRVGTNFESLGHLFFAFSSLNLLPFLSLMPPSSLAVQ
jgi:hypothetical protein